MSESFKQTPTRFIEIWLFAQDETLDRNQHLQQCALTRHPSGSTPRSQQAKTDFTIRIQIGIEPNGGKPEVFPKLSSPVSPSVGGHRLDQWRFEIVRDRKENVKDETPILVWCTFWTNNHRLDTVYPGLIDPALSQLGYHSLYRAADRKKIEECHATGRFRVRIANSLAIASDRLGASFTCISLPVLI